MSKHKSRKSRWVEISPICFASSCGVVTANARGKWDAVVKFKRRGFKSSVESRGLKELFEPGHFLYKYAESLEKTEIVPTFYETKRTIGEYKRAREAMMAVEEAAIQIARQNDDNIIISIDPSLK
jgi:hypothetical protein